MITISLKVPYRMFDEILRYASKNDIYVSEFIRRAIDKYILMLRNKELSEGNPIKMRIVSITISRRPVKAKKRKKIRITPRERLIVRELPPPKIKFIKIVIGGNESGDAHKRASRRIKDMGLWRRADQSIMSKWPDC